MNTITLKHEKINNGEEFVVFTPNTQEYIETQIAEIFVQEHYREGKIKKDMTIIDCGANVGLASLYFKDWAKTIYALEPNPQNYECLLKNTEAYPQIKCFNVGLTAKTTRAFLKEDAGSPIAETLFGEGKEREWVSLMSAQDFFNQNKIDHIDLLKIDTEGAEYLIFPSDSFMKVADKIDYIVGESHYIGVPGHLLMPDYIPLILDKAGFDTKFLPYGNNFMVLKFENDERIDEYRIDKQTMFFAKRKELEWPN